MRSTTTTGFVPHRPAGGAHRLAVLGAVGLAERGLDEDVGGARGELGAAGLGGAETRVGGGVDAHPERAGPGQGLHGAAPAGGRVRKLQGNGQDVAQVVLGEHVNLLVGEGPGEQAGLGEDDVDSVERGPGLLHGQGPSRLRLEPVGSGLEQGTDAPSVSWGSV